MIIVVPYDPVWPQRFLEIRTRVWPAVADIAHAIEHVGSTSVPGLAAKPIIDVDIVIAATRDLAAVSARLEAIGYGSEGDLGVPGRWAFSQPLGLPRHHLYVCVAHGVALRNHLAVREYLRAHPEDVAAYAALKLELAARVEDMDAYVRGKTDFVLSVLRRAGLDAAAMAEIEAANRV